MKAIITVIGKDKVGIVSAISLELAKLNINILDISQTIMDENFTMIMLVDLNKSTNSFEQIKNILTEVSDKLNISIGIVADEFLFNSLKDAANFIYITPDNYEEYKTKRIRFG